MDGPKWWWPPWRRRDEDEGRRGGAPWPVGDASGGHSEPDAADAADGGDGDGAGATVVAQAVMAEVEGTAGAAEAVNERPR